MNIYELAKASVEACEAVKVEYMLTGAFAKSCYGIPRSTTDVDFVINIQNPSSIESIISLLSDIVEFGDQVQFDTITWGKRHIGQTKTSPYLKVELFELFDDPFVLEQFHRRKQLRVPVLDIATYVPTAEDVLIQKLRWARDKDLIDALDILVVQEPENLDMEYIRKWCIEHGSTQRLDDTLAKIPEGL